jgi:hypothetical protein
MSYRLNIRPEAEADVMEAALWYEQRKPGLGEEFITDIHPDNIMPSALEPRSERPTEPARRSGQENAHGSNLRHHVSAAGARPPCDQQHKWRSEKIANQVSGLVSR